MSLTQRFNRFFAILTIAVCIAASAAAQGPTGPGPRIFTVKIKLDDLSMIIVPVSINGSRPYDFMLDTGAAKTMVDRKLAEELALPLVSQKTLVGVMGSTRQSVVAVKSISVAGAMVGGGEIFSAEHPTITTSKVRGVLGEDFLKNFDVLVDYRHLAIELESDTGLLAGTAAGEHLPLQLEGALQEQPALNRLIVSGKIPELGGTPMTLLLDSGTNRVVLFRQNLGAGGSNTEIRTGTLGSWAVSTTPARTVRSLNLGGLSVPDLTVVGLSRRFDADIDGLLPTSLFHAVLICHRASYIILNPSFPTTHR